MNEWTNRVFCYGISNHSIQLKVALSTHSSLTSNLAFSELLRTMVHAQHDTIKDNAVAMWVGACPMST